MLRLYSQFTQILTSDGKHDLFGEFAKQQRPFPVIGILSVFDVLPLGVPGVANLRHAIGGGHQPIGRRHRTCDVTTRRPIGGRRSGHMVEASAQHLTSY